MAQSQKKADASAWEMGCGCAFLLGLVGVVGLVVAVVVWGPNPEPVWGERETVAVEPTPSPSPDEPTDGEGLEPESEPGSAIRSEVEDLVRHRTKAMIGEFPDEVRCEGGGGSLDCAVEYQDLRMDYTVRISNVEVSGPFVSWDHEGATTDAVILAQRGVNELFLDHLPGIGVEADEIEIRCDRIPEPVLVKVNELGEYKCYTREGSGEAGKAYPLKYAEVAGLIFESSER